MAMDLLKLLHTVRDKAEGPALVTFEVDDPHSPRDWQIAGTVIIEGRTHRTEERFRFAYKLTLDFLERAAIDADQFGVILAERYNRQRRAHSATPAEPT